MSILKYYLQVYVFTLFFQINSSIRDKRQNYNVSEVKYSYKKLKHIKLCLMSRNVQKQVS